MKPITVEFGDMIVNTGKFTIKDAFVVALDYGAKADETIRYRETLNTTEIDEKIYYLNSRIGNLLFQLEATPKKDWVAKKVIYAEMDCVKDKIKRLMDYRRKLDYVIEN